MRPILETVSPFPRVPKSIRQKPVTKEYILQNIDRMEKEILKTLKEAEYIKISGKAPKRSILKTYKRIDTFVTELIRQVRTKVLKLEGRETQHLDHISAVCTVLRTGVDDILRKVSLQAGSSSVATALLTEYFHTTITACIEDFDKQDFSGEDVGNFDEVNLIEHSSIQESTPVIFFHPISQDIQEELEDDESELVETGVQEEEVNIPFDIGSFTEVVSSYWYSILEEKMKTYMAADGSHTFSATCPNAIKLLMRYMKGTFETLKKDQENFNEENLSEDNVRIDSAKKYQVVFEGALKNSLKNGLKEKLSVVKEAGGALYLDIFKSFIHYLRLEAETFYGDYSPQQTSFQTEDDLTNLIESERRTYLQSGQEYPWASEQEQTFMLDASLEEKSHEDIAAALNEKFHIGLPIRTAASVEKQIMEFASAPVFPGEEDDQATIGTVEGKEELVISDLERFEAMGEFMKSVHSDLAKKAQSLRERGRLEERIALISSMFHIDYAAMLIDQDESGLDKTPVSTKRSVLNMLGEFEGLLRAKRAEIVQMFTFIEKYENNSNHTADIERLITQGGSELQSLQDLKKLAPVVLQLRKFHEQTKGLIAFRERFLVLIEDVLKLQNELESYPSFVRRTLRKVDPAKLFNTEELQEITIQEEDFAEDLSTIQHLIDVAADAYRKFDALMDELRKLLLREGEDDILHALEQFLNTYDAFMLKLSQTYIPESEGEPLVQETAEVQNVLATKDDMLRLQQRFSNEAVASEPQSMAISHKKEKESQIVPKESRALSMQIVDGRIDITPDLHNLVREEFGLTSTHDLTKELFRLSVPGKELVITRLHYFLLVVMEERVVDRLSHHYGVTGRQLGAITRYFLGDLMPTDITRNITQIFDTMMHNADELYAEFPDEDYSNAALPLYSWVRGATHQGRGSQIRFYRQSDVWSDNVIKHVLQGDVPHISKKVRDSLLWFLKHDQDIVSAMRRR